MADKLIVNGLGKRVDGEYEFDIVDLLSIGGPGALTTRELHRIKVMSGLRRGEFMDAFEKDDPDFHIALVAVLLAREGKTVDEDALWDAPPEAYAGFQLDPDRFKEADGDPPAEPAETPETKPESTNTGASGSTTSEQSRGNGQSSTGPPALLMSVTSGPGTSAT